MSISPGGCRRASCLVATEGAREDRCDAVVNILSSDGWFTSSSSSSASLPGRAGRSRDALRKELQMKLDYRRRASGRCAGFTLLELLAVIFIIVIVAAILLPT